MGSLIPEKKIPHGGGEGSTTPDAAFTARSIVANGIDASGQSRVIETFPGLKSR